MPADYSDQEGFLLASVTPEKNILIKIFDSSFRQEDKFEMNQF